MLQSIYTKTLTNIQKSLAKGSGWIIDSVIDHTISISKYNPLAGSSYIKLPKELDHVRKGLTIYRLHAFITEEILKRHIKDCFEINGKETIKMPKKGKYVEFKAFERKIKSPFMIYADFESVLVPEDNVKQNPNGP